jgi:hypothetical protein
MSEERRKKICDAWIEAGAHWDAVGEAEQDDTDTGRLISALSRGMAQTCYARALEFSDGDDGDAGLSEWPDCDLCGDTGELPILDVGDPSADAPRGRPETRFKQTGKGPCPRCRPEAYEQEPESGDEQEPESDESE